MATAAERRGRAWWSIPAVLGMFVGVPIALIAVTHARLGSASPLAGMDPPWRWSVEGIRRWGRSLGDGLETMDQLVDLFIRVAVLAAWVCVVVIAWTVVAEVLYQLRHGMPSPRRRGDPVSWIGRAIAGGLVGLLSLSAAATPASAALPLRPVTAAAAVVRPTEPVAPTRPQQAAAAADGVLHRVVSGESMWSIAERYADHPDRVDGVAATILAANVGRTMNDGRRFTTAALIEPGWELVIPETVTRQVVVERGDSYWRLAEEHLEQAGADPSEAEVLELTQRTMAHNAPRLGYRNPAMIHPGDIVEFVDDVPAPPADPTVADPPSDPPVADPPVVDPTVADPAGVEPPAAETNGVEPGESTAPVPPASAVEPVPPTLAGPQPPATSPASPATAGPAVPATATPTPAGSAAAVIDEGDASSVPVGLAAAAMLATGVIAVVDSRRRRRLRALTVSQRLDEPDPQAVATERMLRAASATDRFARLDVALRAAATDLAELHVGVLAAAVDDVGNVTIWPTAAALPHGTMWRYLDDAAAWQMPAEVDVTDIGEAARRAEQPCPALVQLGANSHGDFFVDLEAAGVLAILDCPGLVRAVAAGLAVPPMAEDLRLVTTGLTLPDGFAVESAESLDAAMAMITDHRQAVAAAAGGRSTFAVRAGGRSWGDTGPLVVVAQLGDHRQVEAAACPAHAGVALVVDTPVETDLVVRPVGGGWWALDRIAVEFRPVQLDVADVEAVERVLGAADQPAESDAVATALDTEVELTWAADEPPVEERSTLADEAEEAESAADEWRIVVRLFGPVAIETDAGEVVAFNRAKAQELVVWMSQHRTRSTRQVARTALWDTDVRDATFSNVVSDARRALARAIAPTRGEEWIGRTLTEQLALHPQVVTDSDVMAELRRRARQEPGRAAELLSEALRWVRGAPYESTTYLWPDAEGLTSQLIIQATGIAAELAELAMASGDTELAFWATSQGLLALPGHEQLVALRMRIHRQIGSLAGVRQEWESYERALRADVWSDGEPSPMLASLRHELLSGAGPAA